MDTDVSIAITVTAAPLESSSDTLPPQALSFLSVNFSAVAKRKGPVHLLLIYLGHACENRSIFWGSRRARIRERGCDCREIKPLKVMPCLIFRAANERSSSLSQTSSQAAIIPSRGSVLGRQKAGNITSPDVPTLYVFVEALRVCVCLSVCVWKCASVSVNSACLCICLHIPISLSSCLCHLVVL